MYVFYLSLVITEYVVLVRCVVLFSVYFYVLRILFTNIVNNVK